MKGNVGVAGEGGEQVHFIIYTIYIYIMEMRICQIEYRTQI